jgi:hypothetical protein
MMIKTAERMWGAALLMSPGYLIDKFLDWIEELSEAMVPARVEELVRVEARRDPFRA